MYRHYPFSFCIICVVFVFACFAVLLCVSISSSNDNSRALVVLVFCVFVLFLLVPDFSMLLLICFGSLSVGLCLFMCITGFRLLCTLAST